MASHGGQDFFEGTIDRINDDGTYAIHYADGDREGYPKGDEHFNPQKPGVLHSDIKPLNNVAAQVASAEPSEDEGAVEEENAVGDNDSIATQDSAWTEVVSIEALRARLEALTAAKADCINPVFEIR